MNMSPKNKALSKSEKEAIHLILTGIGDEIYSTVDDCQTAQEMWEAIKRLQQGESINIQDLTNEMIRNNLTVATMQVNVQFLQQLQPEWSRYKGKEIAKPITPPSESAFEEDSDLEQAQRDKDMQKNLALITKYLKRIYKPTNNNLRTSSNPRNKNVDTTSWENVGSLVVQQYRIQCFNCKEFGHFAKECRKPKRVKDSKYHKEKMLLCKQAEKEIDEQELEAHYSYMAKIQEVPTTDSYEQSESISNTCIVETNKSNVILDLPDMCEDDIQNDQNDVESDDEQKHSISLELALQQFKEHVQNDTVFNDQASNVFRKEREQYFKIQDLKAQLQDKNISISELTKLIKKCKGKSVETKFDKPSVVRQPNAQRIPKPSVLGVNHKTNVSRPQHRSNQMKDNVMPNNSQVKLKKTQVEDHHIIASISNKIKSVTACNDSLNSRTSNVKAVCATRGKCLVDSDHFACVTKMLNDVNARTKKPNVVPISTRKPKGHANKSVGTPHKKKVTSKSTTQKPKSYYRMPYEKTNLVQGNIMINKVYYVEGLNHNLFLVGQFYDADLEAAFRKSTCFVRDLQGNDLLIGNHGSDL
nr:retrovirus-related Pol polyprotein from transposon TNT 1-94 [Tanacetum cinerariifolium]